MESAWLWLLLAAHASACARTEPDRIAADPNDRQPAETATTERPAREQPRTVPEPLTPPPSVCDLGCPVPFMLLIGRATPWEPGAYYFRVSVDDAPAQVCSVVFEPVLGAAHDTCNGAGLPFYVSYEYDSSVQQISALSFLSVQRVVEVELLVAEDEPPLLELRHELSWLPASGCNSCRSARSLSAQIAGPTSSADAGSPPADAGSSADAGDAAASAPSP
jgi:hypothetical protein